MLGSPVSQPSHHRDLSHQGCRAEWIFCAGFCYQHLKVGPDKNLGQAPTAGMRPHINATPAPTALPLQLDSQHREVFARMQKCCRSCSSHSVIFKDKGKLGKKCRRREQTFPSLPSEWEAGE